ncbi:MAG: FHA domain-containing protein, partial [Planctomycetes bacterium]|nr:FHA domain-containing protein [Planctomycetota bacterium]
LEQAGRKDPAASQLRREIANRAEDAAGLVAQAEMLIAQGQLAAAAERVRRAKAIDAQDNSVGLIETRICNQVLDNARKAIVEGRLKRAADELACLGPLGDSLPSKRELTDMLATAREATDAVGAGRYGDARQHVLTLARLLPDVTWVTKAVEDLKRIDEIRTALCGGPLGERVGDSPPTAARKEGARPQRRSLDDTVALPYRADAGARGLPDRLLLLVDGGGSYLLLMGGQASIGRAASDKPADVPVFSDIAERHANIARVDEDYFFFSSKVAEVAGRRAKHQLLRDGDRIVLGARRNSRSAFRAERAPPPSSS